jgi:hypothetical protein
VQVEILVRAAQRRPNFGRHYDAIRKRLNSNAKPSMSSVVSCFAWRHRNAQAAVSL